MSSFQKEHTKLKKNHGTKGKMKSIEYVLGNNQMADIPDKELKKLS